MKVAVYSARKYDTDALTRANEAEGNPHALVFHDIQLTPNTVRVAEGSEAVCVFVNDDVGRETLRLMSDMGIRAVATRSAGRNHIDAEAADELGIEVRSVPAYSPHGVAEYAVALMLTLNRKIHRAFNRVREGNFALDGLLGFDMHGKTVGVVGTGLIGACVCRILLGMGCRVLAYDVRAQQSLERAGVVYMPLEEMLPQCDILTLHCPLLDATRNLIDAEAIERMPDHAMLINTSRGGLMDTGAAYAALRAGRLGSLGIDVYEEESELFFEDRSDTGLTDELLARLVALPQALVTGHQAFFTSEALEKIAEITIRNLSDMAGR
ncbi:2-hydroxyacid dehydrogenase [Mucisphaera calidilacus]|uniref:D-lactate dehydrogenase n=1 Tax=Mucisphaera calidilacus TaxID=2527982 RepID=A0A518BUN1_9BACT|nr:2-hydroxyacid dehydrogenase [Mucisphaera calidilacus]QDU70692.1 D-lactate dehydrogenase [Mucisphaera calidilacus]